MAIVDDRGRLFGRLNLVDAILGFGIVGLIPLGYAAYTLFRTPAPRLIAVEPATIAAAPQIRIAVRGENFRPYLRLSLGTQQADNFLVGGTDQAEADVRNIAPGAYDVVLYDYERERARLPGALTVVPSPIPETQALAIGAIGNLTATTVPQVKPGLVIPSVGEIVQVGSPLPEATQVYVGPRMVALSNPGALRLPTVIRVGCFIRSREGRPDCWIGSAPLQPGSLHQFATPFGMLPFQVEDVRSTAPLETVHAVVRFSNLPGVVSLIRPGDVDVTKTANELAAEFRVTHVVTLSPGVREASLVIQVQREAGGWVHASEPLRVGGVLRLRTAVYDLTGVVTSIDPSPITVATPSPQ